MMISGFVLDVWIVCSSFLMFVAATVLVPYSIDKCIEYVKKWQNHL